MIKVSKSKKRLKIENQLERLILEDKDIQAIIKEKDINITDIGVEVLPRKMFFSMHRGTKDIRYITINVPDSKKDIPREIERLKIAIQRCDGLEYIKMLREVVYFDCVYALFNSRQQGYYIVELGESTQKLIYTSLKMYRLPFSKKRRPSKDYKKSKYYIVSYELQYDMKKDSKEIVNRFIEEYKDRKKNVYK